jgi:hypothetical protein
MKLARRVFCYTVLFFLRTVFAEGNSTVYSNLMNREIKFVNDVANGRMNLKNPFFSGQ